ncbi:MAG TPA: GTPase HflX [Acidobacteriaceae bacterium]|nr:GTPase HflX [Acidobacteriaceae bacterium]
MPLNATGSTAERVLLVTVVLGSPRKALTRGAAQARDAALSAPGASTLVPDEDSRLTEFRELVLSAGAVVAGDIVQHRAKADPATLIGSGKVEELSAIAASTQADIAIVDHDLSPTQLRNLENALPCRVIDRTQLILDIFARHARTREGQLQVELAQLEYMLPRLTGRGKAMSQLGGGIGTRGPGETQLETDRRRIQRRVLQLRGELEAVRRTRSQQRQRRESVPVPTVALVGYTNAGKSTLFNAITRAGVLESSRMFATLDPKLSAVQLPSRRKILLSDTVGFIRDLPHTLVTSFRATLEEVRKAEILVHVRDASSPMSDEHKAEVEKVLGELGVLDKPRLEVLNKIDLLGEEERVALTKLGGRLVATSAKERIGLEALIDRIDEELVQDPILEQRLQVPQSEGDALAALEAGTVIRDREYQGNLVKMTVAGPASLLGRYRRFRLNARKSTQKEQTG